MTRSLRPSFPTALGVPPVFGAVRIVVAAPDVAWTPIAVHIDNNVLHPSQVACYRIFNGGSGMVEFRSLSEMTGRGDVVNRHPDSVVLLLPRGVGRLRRANEIHEPPLIGTDTGNVVALDAE